jgi:eukaryotic-like serine/threonine-protein kinase
VSEGGAIQLVDFGIAHRIGDTNPFEHGQILGTPRYLAPEQLQERALDGRTDLYALGVVLYEALTGRLPWPDGPVFKRLAAEVAPLPDTVPADLAGAILRALEVEPEDRWSDAAEFRAAVG